MRNLVANSASVPKSLPSKLNRLSAELVIAAMVLLFAGTRGSSSWEETAPADGKRLTRPVHTFSIVARDATTGELGVVLPPT